MSASSSTPKQGKPAGVEDKSLQLAQDEDKGNPSQGSTPAALDSRADAADLRASDSESADVGKVRIMYVHHVGDKKPGGHATLFADEANDLIRAGVAKLDPAE